jgi:hypothetical protein
MQKESEGRLLLSFFDIVNLDTVGVDACIPRADASIRPYNYAKFVGVGVPDDPQRMFLIEKERYYA